MTGILDNQGIPNRVRYALVAVLICSALLLGIVAPVDAASLMTDKADYPPWETVYISGEGFTPGAAVTMTVEWPAPDSGIYEVLPSAIADDAGRIAATYSLTSGPNGGGLEGTYTINAVDSVTGQGTATTFTDGFDVPAGEHWIIFKQIGLPSNSKYIYAYYEGKTPNGEDMQGTARFLLSSSNSPVKTKSGSPFTYQFLNTSVVTTSGTYPLYSTSTSDPSLGASGVSGGTYSYITGYYEKPPDAAFTFSPTDPKVLETVTFADGSTDFNGGRVTGWSWKFGDSGTSLQKNPTHTYAAAGTYVVTLTVTDDQGAIDTVMHSITVKPDNQPPIVDAGNELTGTEGAAIALTGAFTDDSDIGTHTIVWDFGDGTTASNLETTHTYADNGLYTATLTVTDAGGLSASDTLTVNIANAAPVVSGVTVPTGPVAVNTVVSANVAFTDAGKEDTHTALWTWGSGSTFNGDVTEPSASALGTVTGSNTYTTPGIYTVSVSVTDNGGGVGSQTATTDVVVYDPNGGFATGGGWYNSPNTAVVNGQTGTSGKVNFAFVTKYKNGAAEPESSAKFLFKAADIDFESTGNEWLVVAGSRAVYRGTGVLKGGGEYKFLISVTDGPDKIRIKIWDKDTGYVVYDNLPGMAESAEPQTAIGGGSVVVHG